MTGVDCGRLPKALREQEGEDLSVLWFNADSMGLDGYHVVPRVENPKGLRAAWRVLRGRYEAKPVLRFLTVFGLKSQNKLIKDVWTSESLMEQLAKASPLLAESNDG